MSETAISRPTRAFNVRLTEEQHQRLRDGAKSAGMTMQAYVETQLFGEFRPRAKNGTRPIRKPQSEELPLTG